MIEVKHLDKSFGDLHILKDISTNIEKGEKVVINFYEHSDSDVKSLQEIHSMICDKN